MSPATVITASYRKSWVRATPGGFPVRSWGLACNQFGATIGAAKILGLDEDGTACSSDYYLRLTNDGGRMLKGEIELTDQRPTSPMPGGEDEAERVVALKATANEQFVTVSHG